PGTFTRCWRAHLGIVYGITRGIQDSRFNFDLRGREIKSPLPTDFRSPVPKVSGGRKRRNGQGKIGGRRIRCKEGSLQAAYNRKLAPVKLQPGNPEAHYTGRHATISTGGAIDKVQLQVRAHTCAKHRRTDPP